MEHYLVPFAQKVLEDNPDIDEKILPLLEAELTRLNILNKAPKCNAKKGKAKNSNLKQKCSNSDCKHNSTIDTTNIKAYGQCVSCSDFEHFKCAGTKVAIREDIMSNIVKFIDSAKNYDF